MAFEQPSYWHENQADAAPRIKTLRAGTHTARQPWTCTTCGEQRPPGTIYASFVGTVDGEFVSTKTCVMTPNYGCSFKAKTYQATFQRRTPPVSDDGLPLIMTLDVLAETQIGAIAEAKGCCLAPHLYDLLQIVEKGKEG